MHFWKKSLLAKLVGSFLILYLAVLSSVNYFILNKIETEFKTSIFARLGYIASVKERELNSWITERSRDIISISSLPEIKEQTEILLTEEAAESESQNAFEKIERSLDNFNTEGWENIYILDRTGKILFSTNSDEVGKYKSSDNYREIDSNSLSKIELKFYTAPNDNNPKLSLATALTDEKEQIIGRLVADLDLRKIEIVIREKNELGETIESYLIVDRPPNLISGNIWSWQKLNENINSQEIRQAIENQKDRDVYFDRNGIKSLGVYRRMENYPAGLLVEIEQKEAYTALNRVIRSTVIIDLSVAAFFVLAILITIGKIVKPIKEITRSATKIAAGNLQYRTPVLTQDEIGILARSFNQMTEQLQSLYAALEKKVEDRTAKLKQANEQLQLEINQRKQTEEELNKAKETAEVASRAKTQFLARMSHELRTPLNAILGFSELLRGKIKNKELINNKQQEYLEIINRSGKNLLESIESILEMSKIEAGEIEINETEFDLYRLLDNLEDRFKIKAEAKEIKLSFDRADNLPQYIKTDEAKLNQTLINLIDNAIKFTNKGNVTVRSDWERKKDRELEFEIEDTGVGIAPEEINNLFKPFGQTKTGEKSERGMGLGLAIAKEFIELMGGKITVDSEDNRGTTFKFSLQVNTVESDINIEKETEQIAIGLAENEREYYILVVEDNWENRELLTYLLETIGFETLEATNGEEAIAISKKHKPDLILMDMEMPVMNGFNAAKKIKSSRELNSTKIIALTGNTSARSRTEILACGCDDYISKPFKDQILLEKIAVHLGIEYIYEDWHEEITEIREDGKQELTVSDLQIMPKEWISQLYYLAAAADSERIFELLDRIPEEGQYLGESIASLVDNFSFEEIVDLAELAMKNTEPRSD